MRSARHTLLAVVAALASGAIAPGSATATTLVKKNLDALVTEADGVVIGTVGKISPVRDASRRIHSFVTLGSLQVVHGQFKGQELTLRLAGGQVDDVVQRIEGTPELTPGERVVVFVHGNGRRTVPIVGWTQGVFRVVKDELGATRVHDHEGNRVLGVVAGEVKAEQTRRPEARIVDPGAVLPAGGIGNQRSDDVQPPAPAAALGLDEFLAVVRATAKNKGAVGRIVANVDPAVAVPMTGSSAAPPPLEPR